MKKVVSLSLILVICLSFIATFSGCATNHPIAKFQKKMQKEKNYQITMTMTGVPLFGTIIMTTKIDGNIQYTPAGFFNEEEYIETVGDIQYKYTKNDDGTWRKEENNEANNSSTVPSTKNLEEFYNPKNYEKVKGEKNTFKLKDDVSFESFDDIIITVEKDSCIIEMRLVSEGLTFNAVMEFSNFGEIELTLPEVE